MYFNALFNMLKNPATMPRGWWDAPHAGRCRGMLRVRSCIYGLASVPGTAGVKLKSGAAYLIGQSGNLIRVNHPRNKHERRAYEKKLAADFKSFANEYGLPTAITTSP
jgi:hypothetical protein